MTIDAIKRSPKLRDRIYDEFVRHRRSSHASYYALRAQSTMSTPL
jgi:hypothetical protein